MSFYSALTSRPSGSGDEQFPAHAARHQPPPFWSASAGRNRRGFAPAARWIGFGLGIVAEDTQSGGTANTQLLGSANCLSRSTAALTYVRKRFTADCLSQRISVLHVRLIMRGQSSVALGYFAMPQANTPDLIMTFAKAARDQDEKARWAPLATGLAADGTKLRKQVAQPLM